MTRDEAQAALLSGQTLHAGAWYFGITDDGTPHSGCNDDTNCCFQHGARDGLDSVEDLLDLIDHYDVLGKLKVL